MKGFNPLSMILGLINPFLGIASRGIGSLKGGFKGLTGKMRGINPLTGEPNTQAEYEAMVDNRRTESRRDKMQSRIDKGYNSMFGMRTSPITDQQRATLANLNTQTGVKNNVIGGDPTSTRFDGFAPRIGLQTPNYQTGSVSFDPSLGNRFNSGSVNFNPGLGNTSTVTNQPSKGIMQTIGDAFFSPAGAAEFDMEAFQKAGADKSMIFGANDELEAMKEYYDAATSLSAPGSKFAGATNPNEIRSFIDKQSSIPFGGGSYGVNMDMVPTNFMNTTEDFTTQKDPLSFFADGGLASMFTRRR